MKFLLIFLILYLVYPFSVSAIYDPLSVPNNKYGIHIADVNDLKNTRDLINSGGGDWGYVTIVIQDGQKHFSLWQDIFNQMRRMHLIPIIRIATHINGQSWSIPQKDDAEDWARFLNSLNWPTENRYIVIFNEPNHANEWGGSINPENYADIFVEYSSKLKSKNPDFFILPAALDVSAANTNQSMDAINYWNRMISSKPELFDLIDGWNSHSYPNPAFSAPPFNFGRGSLRSYLWELSYLKQLGLNRQLPVFITETGWKHSQGKTIDSSLLQPSTLATYIQDASNYIWNDANIVAITPFVFNYQDYPFDHFSWKMIDSDNYYPFYDSFRNIPKISGKPHQNQNYLPVDPILPKSLVASSYYQFNVKIKNTGQNIFDVKDGYGMNFIASSEKFQFKVLSSPVLEPDQEDNFSYSIKTPMTTGKFHIQVQVGKESNWVTVSDLNLNIIPPPSLAISAKFGFKINQTVNNASVLVYDKQDQLLHKFNQVHFDKGTGVVTYLTNVVPNNTYRIVLIVPGYLPRQTVVNLSALKTNVKIERMLPFDFDQDGQFNLNDIKILILKGTLVFWQQLF
jgi:hypothetical protein